MNLRMSGVGAEKKRLIILGVLLGFLAIYYFWPSSTSTPSVSTSRSEPEPTGTFGPPTSPRVPARQASRGPRGQAKNVRNVGEFKPSLKIDKDAPIDRNSIDPTLHLDLLARLKNVKVESSGRSVFDFGAAPPPVQLTAKEPDKILVATRQPVGPRQPPPPPGPPPPPVEASAPPVPLKFYGFVSQNKAGVKSAFFLDGEDIILAKEGQLIKSRYKIVRIGINSAVVEDTQFKKNSEQTLPLVEEITG